MQQLELNLTRTDLRSESELGNPVTLENITTADNCFYPMRFDSETIHPNYLVNCAGEIYSLSHKKLITQMKRGGVSNHPYLCMTIKNPITGIQQTLNTHRFIAHTFLLPSGTRRQVNHICDDLIDEVKCNNVDNLEWLCPKGNSRKGVAARKVKAFSLEMPIVEWMEFLHGMPALTADLKGIHSSHYRGLCKSLRSAITAEIAIEDYCISQGLQQKLLEVYEDSLAVKSDQLDLFDRM